MDMIRWMFAIYCLSVGAYMTSMFGWWSPPYSSSFLTFGGGVSDYGTLSPVSYVFGWELIKSVGALLSLAVLAPVYLHTFLGSFLPLWVVTPISSTMGVVFYVGFAQLLLRIRGGV